MTHAEDYITGFRFAQLDPAAGITISATEQNILKIQFNRKGDHDGDNPIKLTHFGETKDSASARAVQWIWNGSGWTIPDASEAFRYDTQRYLKQEIRTGSAAEPLWTGMTITPNNERETFAGFDWYLKNGDTSAGLHPADEAFVISGEGPNVDKGDIYYGRHIWTITPEPQPLDPPIGPPFEPEWDPDPIPVPHDVEPDIDPEPEEYVVPEEPDPDPATEDVIVPIYYHEKQIAITYMVNDAALGAVDPQTESYPVVTGLPIGSSATATGASTFLNWTNEAGEVVSTDLNYLPEKFPLPEPEANGTSNNKDFNEIYASQVYTANFQAGTGGQTGDNMGFLVSIIMLIIAVNAAYILTNRRRNYGKHTK